MNVSSLGRRQGVAYVVLIATSLLLLAFSGSAPVLQLRHGVGFAVAPMQAGLRQVTVQLTSVFATFAELERLRQANAELQRVAQELEAENRNLENVRTENERLTELLEVRSSLEYETVAAEVIGRQTSEAERVISLDRGSDDGVAVGDPVVGAGGALVGQVEDVGTNFSRVLLLNDSRFVVVGLVEGSRATGEVWGQLERPLSMLRIPSTEEITVGESVVTAGIELEQGVRSSFPKGLLVGSVVDVEQSPNQVVQTALLQPAVPLDRLEYVLVITDYEGGIPLETPGSTPIPAP